jgi:pSer/pThr/pTyr-binding forkhead associated (FHA) protein
MPAPVCPRCSTQNAADSAFCRTCGTPLTSGARTDGAKGAARPRVAIRVVRADGGPEIVVSMRGEELTCGTRGDIPLEDDPFVAATQARFFLTGGRLAVEDVGGGNGIFLRLHKEHELTTGGELRLGRQRLVLEPVPAMGAASGGEMIWGSPDVGYRFRLIQILEGGTRGAAFVLKDGENLLGRESGDITFPTDGFVSGRHAVLQVRQHRLFVRDIGSSNGTFLRLSAPTALENGDHLLIGRELLRIEVGER